MCPLYCSLYCCVHAHVHVGNSYSVLHSSYTSMTVQLYCYMIVVLEGFCGGPRWCAEGARVAGRRLGGLHGCPRGRPTAWVGCGAAWWGRGRSAATGRGEVLQDLRGPAGLNSWGARRGASTLPSLVVIASVQEEVARKALRRTIHGSERPSRLEPVHHGRERGCIESVI